MKILNLLFGKPLAASDERAEQLGKAAGIPIFGLDALSSAAYGPEAALTLLIPIGAASVAYIIPISSSIIVLLAIVYFSYRQTIAAYPGGGGSYTVASENLGTFAGLLAAAALMIDYILTVAVGISAGVGALVSAVPKILPHTLSFCLIILILITFINLRGMRQAGIIFMVPTYLFVGSLLAAIGWGVFKSVMAGGHPVPVVAPPAPGGHIGRFGDGILDDQPVAHPDLAITAIVACDPLGERQQQRHADGGAANDHQAAQRRVAGVENRSKRDACDQ